MIRSKEDCESVDQVWERFYNPSIFEEWHHRLCQTGTLTLCRGALIVAPTQRCGNKFVGAKRLGQVSHLFSKLPFIIG